MSICAIIPAAGRGTRLNSPIPKLFLPIKHETVWSILYDKLKDLVTHIHVVLSPSGYEYGKTILDPKVTSSIQQKPEGMGQAIFGAYDIWQSFDTLLIVWGDQVSVSYSTLKTAINMQDNKTSCLTLPLVKMSNPYVDYIFQDEQLIKILQSREGDLTRIEGLSDVGTFILSTHHLLKKWQNYLLEPKICGAKTAEINFLPFLTYLSMQGFTVQSFLVKEKVETRGINTKEDLMYFQNREIAS